MVAFYGLVYGVAKVAQHVPAISDLDGLRSAVAGTLGVGAGAIARDDLHSGVIPQPGREGLGLSIRQQVHHLVPLEVDQDRPVAMTAAPSPIVDAQHARGHQRCGVAAGLACGP